MSPIGDRLYLKQTVVMEPLVDGWYAWSHLIPPATLGLNHLRRHLKIIDSYIAAPEIHVAAAEDTSLRSGPFLNIPLRYQPTVEFLGAKIKKDQSALLSFAQDLVTVEELLSSHSGAKSLKSYYSDLPETLRGYIEFVYDMHNHVDVRVCESLLYRSRYFRKESQSIVLREVDSEKRPFVLSTPHINLSNEVRYNVAFTSPIIDQLSMMRMNGLPRLWALELLEEAGAPGDVGAQLLTNTPPSSAPYFGGSDVRWRYFGHACVLIECGGVAVITDPLVANSCAVGRDHYDISDLPERIDFAIISHAHQDHFVLETLLELRHKIDRVVVPSPSKGALQDPSLRLLLKNIGFKDVVEVSSLDSLEVGPVTITALPFLGEHCDLDIGSKTSYLVDCSGFRLFFAVDTCNVDSCTYDHVREIIGPVDVLFLSMECDGAPLDWLYGPLVMAARSSENISDERTRRLDASDFPRAAHVAKSLGCREAYVYAMGQEPWFGHLLALNLDDNSHQIQETQHFIDWCKSKGVHAEMLAGKAEGYGG